MDNPNVFAGYVAMILPLSLAATMRSSRWFAILGLATTAVGVAALVLTYSRAGWVAGVLGIVIVIFAGIRYAPRKCGVVILLLLAFFSAFVVFFKPALFQRVQGIVSPTQGTVQHRLFMWQAGFSMLRAHPLTGVGMGCYESAFATYRPKGTMKPFALITAPGSAHNDWVQWCAETGIVGIVLVVIGVLLMISIRIQARREQKVTSDTPLFYWGALGTLVAWAVGGVGQSYLAYPLCALIVCLAFAWLLTDGSVDIRDSGRGITLQYVVLMIALFVVCAGTPIISYARGLRERSECELLANNTQRALEYLHQARIWNPLDVSTLGLGGDTYADLAWASNDSGDQSHLWLANADTWYRQCTNNEPTNGKWHCRLADIQERRGDLHGALISYRRAIKNDWYRASYHLQAGRLAKRLGYPKEARAHLEQAAILFPVWIELSRQRTGPNSIETQTYRNAYNDAKTLLDELISTHRTGAWYVSTGLHFFTSGGEIWHGPVGHKLVALTFDDGPNPLYQSQILATLKRFDAHATFFLVGNMVRKYPQLTRDILADGHELANHSFSHRNMVNLNGDQIIDEVLKARTAIKEVTGKQTYLFRPPGGNVDDFVIRKLRTLDYNTVYWGVNVSEFRNYPLSQQAAMIINKVNDGSIILFHCGPVDRSIDVLAPLLAELTKRGYSCVSVSELMRN